MADENETLADAQRRMQRSVEALTREFNAVRTGRASPALVDNLMVEYYGTMMPLNQLASISVPEARTLQIEPWDKNAVAGVERSILKSDLGLVPNNDGAIIRLNLPVLTEERRRDLVKLVGRKLEEGHVAVRNIRRDGLSRLRQMEKDKEIAQDTGRHAQERLQQLTDTFIGRMDGIARDKQAEVMEV
jgi:ribosome recycling factor